uniref:Cytochrome P450 n=1 Tax=Panagrellus redivivus TaxID=6233 RepID=A0A7E4UME8_PANRE
MLHRNFLQASRIAAMKDAAIKVCAMAGTFYAGLAVLKVFRNWILFKGPLLAIGITLIAIYIFHELYLKRRKLPPGPTPLLAVGNMLNLILAKDMDTLFVQWKQKYGGIYTFWMGPIPMVFVSDVETMKRYFVKHADQFSHRWRNFITDAMLDGFNGVVQIDGDKWREQRRFSLHVLRDFGVGRALMEDKIMHQVNILIKHLESISQNGPMTMTEPIAVCVGNIINDMLFGTTFEHTDLHFQKMQKMLDKQVRVVMNPLMGLYLVAPWTTQIPVINAPWKELMEIREVLWNFLGVQIDDHTKTFVPYSEATDFTYAYMNEMHDRRVNGRDMGFFSDKQLKMLLLDLFFAGMETTVTTAKWGILMLMLHPEVQKKAQEELDQFPDRIVLADKPRLTYLNAVINEIQRMANILPFNLLRAVAEDVEIDGYRFPAGSMVLPQISIALNDPDHFPEAEKFNPDRFLDENGNLRKIDAFMPFSLGKRQCLGESLARAELFLIFANLLRNFEFHVVDEKHRPSAKRMYGLTVSPEAYSCDVRRRRC